MRATNPSCSRSSRRRGRIPPLSPSLSQRLARTSNSAPPASRWFSRLGATRGMGRRRKKRGKTVRAPPRQLMGDILRSHPVHRGRTRGRGASLSGQTRKRGTPSSCAPAEIAGMGGPRSQLLLIADHSARTTQTSFFSKASIPLLSSDPTDGTLATPRARTTDCGEGEIYKKLQEQ